MIGRKKLFVVATVIALLGCVIAVKAMWFPTIKNVWFQLDNRQLAAAPGHLVVFRDTCLSTRKSGTQAAFMGYQPGTDHEPILRYSGRNVPLQEIIPLAYQCQPSDIEMPFTIPTNRYDFLVTVAKQPRDRLRQAFEKKTGFTADWQEREADAWFLKVQNPNVFQPSTNTESRIEMKNGRLVFMHMPINTVIGFMQQKAERPVEDKTELSGFYDFSISASWLNQEPKDEKELKPLLDELGLTMVEGTSTRRMLIVHRK